MATAHLATLHTAALRLREAADRFLVAFEQAAAEALLTPPALPAAKSQHQRKGKAPSAATLAILGLAARAQGVTAPEAGAAIDRSMANASARLLDLVGRGKLVAARSSYSAQGKQRYFLTTEAAEAWAAEQGPPEIEARDAATSMTLSSRAEDPFVITAQSVRPSAAMRTGPQFGADTRDQVVAEVAEQVSRIPADIADMVAAAAPAVEKAMATLAPAARAEQPTPSAPPPKPYIPPTPAAAQRPPGSEAANAKRAADAGMPRPTGEVIVPPDVKRTVAAAPAYDLRFGVDPKAAGTDPESFSAQWKRLRGEGATT